MRILLSKVKNIFLKALKANNSASKLALSFCMGVYVAFSPFPGGHTAIMFFFQWIFRLNFPILFFATSLNNPWTMIPFFIVDYSFGYWFVHSVLGWDPYWAISLERVFGSGKICVWSFLIGGNILGIITALFCYPLALKFLKKFRLTKCEGLIN